MQLPHGVRPLAAVPGLQAHGMACAHVPPPPAPPSIAPALLPRGLQLLLPGPLSQHRARVAARVVESAPAGRHNVARRAHRLPNAAQPVAFLSRRPACPDLLVGAGWGGSGMAARTHCLGERSTLHGCAAAAGPLSRPLTVPAPAAHPHPPPAATVVLQGGRHRPSVCWVSHTHRRRRGIAWRRRRQSSHLQVMHAC